MSDHGDTSFPPAGRPHLLREEWESDRENRKLLILLKRPPDEYERRQLTFVRVPVDGSFELQAPLPREARVYVFAHTRLVASLALADGPSGLLSDRR